MTLLTPRRSPSDERGVTILEVTIASMLLVAAMGIFLAGLTRTQKTESYTTARQQSLDDLRMAANEFARDARAATAVTLATGSRVEFAQYVGPDIEDTVWEVFTDADGGKQLRRTRDGGVRVFLVELTDDTVFLYSPANPDPTDPSAVYAPDVRRIKLFMSTKPLADYPDVDLTTEVTLRNVD